MENSAERVQLRLLLVGGPGHGKSATGNTILGKNHFKASRIGTDSLTSACQVASARFRLYDITVVDTPGKFWSSTNSTNDEALAEFSNQLKKCIQESRITMNAIVIVISCIARMNLNKELTFIRQRLENVFCSDVKNHCILLFTHDDELDDDFEKTQLLSELSSEWKAQSFFFNNKLSSLELKEKQIEKLLEKVNKVNQHQPFIFGMKMDSNENHELLDNNQERTIVIVGKTGTGKSATCNTILGDKIFKVGKSFESITESCNIGSALYNNYHINVIDTPGVFGQNFSADSADKFINDICKCLSLAKRGIDAIIITISLNSRFTEEDLIAIQILQNIFGERFKRYSIMLFTNCDQLEESVTLQQYTTNVCPQIKDFIHRKQYIGFNNMLQPEESKNQVQDLLKLVEEVLQANGNKPYFNNRLHEDIQVHEKYKGKSKNEILEDVVKRHLSRNITLTESIDTIEIPSSQLQESPEANATHNRRKQKVKQFMEMILKVTLVSLLTVGSSDECNIM